MTDQQHPGQPDSIDMNALLRGEAMMTPAGRWRASMPSSSPPVSDGLSPEDAAYRDALIAAQEERDRLARQPPPTPTFGGARPPSTGIDFGGGQRGITGQGPQPRQPSMNDLIREAASELPRHSGRAQGF